MRTLLITFAVLILLLVGADIGGRALAESKAGEAIATRASLATAPDVTIHGFSFLAQAVPGHYQKITVDSADLTLGPVSGVAAAVDLYDVTLPLSDALSGNTSHLTAARADLRAVIPAASLAGALQKAGLTLSAGPDGSIQMATTVTIAGQSIPITASVTASFADGKLHLGVTSVSGGGISLPAIDSLVKALSLDIPLNNLPVPVTGGSVTVQGSDLVINAQATDIVADTLR